SQSSFGPSTTPSPHDGATQTPPLHTLPAAASLAIPASLPGPQLVPSPTGVPAVQTCVVSLHVPCPAHGSLGAQSRVGSAVTHEYLHVVSQPSPLVALPSSHSSGAVTIPSPHVDVVHVPPLHTCPAPHDCPSPSGVPALHV